MSVKAKKLEVDPVASPALSTEVAARLAAIAAEAATRSSTDTLKQDAATAATDAELASEAAARAAADAGLIPSTQKGAVNGIASLGSDGKVPTGQLPSGAPVTVISSPTASQALVAGNGYRVTLDKNVTFTATATAGAEGPIDLLLTQDATGGRTVTWFAGITWLQGAPPTLPVGPGQSLLLTFLTLDGGTSWYGSYASVQAAWPDSFFQPPVIGGANSRTHTANSSYVAEIALPAVPITGITFENATVANANVIVSLYDAAGNRVATSGSVAQVGTNVLQQIPFTTPYTPPAGGKFYVTFQFSNATGNTYDVYYGTPTAVIAQGGFAAPASITPPTSLTNNTVPAFSTY